MFEVRKRRLSRRRVLEAALGLVDREGLAALSMRRLGAELGVEAMSLYNHVPNKEALLDGMVEVMLGELEVPSGSEDWEERIREAYRALRELAHAHPNVFPLLGSRPPHAPDGLWLVEEFLREMRGAGFAPETALHAFRVLSNYTFGYAMAEIRGFALEPDASRPGAGELSQEEFPYLREISPKLASVDHDAEFEFGLGLILSGLRERL